MIKKEPSRNPRSCKLHLTIQTFHQTPIPVLMETTEPRTLSTTNAGENVERREHSLVADGSAKWCRASEGSAVVSYMLLAYDVAAAVLGICPEELKPQVRAQTCTRMLTAVLFIRARS